MTATTIPKRPRLPELSLPPQDCHYSIPALRKVVFRLQSSNTVREHVVISLGDNILHKSKPPAEDWHNVIWFLAVLVLLLVFAGVSAHFICAR